MLYRNTPPDPADDPIAAVIDRLMAHPKAQEVLGNVSSRVDWFAQFLDGAMKGELPRAPRPQGQGRSPPPPPRPPPPPAFDENKFARSVMGFKASDVLTEDIIKRRYRILAKEHHPDKTRGDDTRMKAINAARDTLLKGVA